MKAQQDSELNTYTITKNGETFTLNPLPDNARDGKKEAGIMLIREKEMLKTLKEENVGVALILKPKDVTG